VNASGFRRDAQSSPSTLSLSALKWLLHFGFETVLADFVEETL
jgi:hypothetical protein